MPWTPCCSGIGASSASSIPPESGGRDAWRQEGQVEAVSVLVARRAIARADVAVIVLDATEGPTDQDAAIAGEAERAGRGIIVAANKWDLVKDQGADFAKTFDEELRRKLKFLDYAPVLHISALTGERTPRLLEIDRPGGRGAQEAGPDGGAQPLR